MLWITALMIKRYADANPQWVGSKSYKKLLLYIRQNSTRVGVSSHSKRIHKIQKKKRPINDRRSRSNIKIENKLTSCRINNLEKEIDCIRKRIIKVRCERDSLALDLAKITATLKIHK
ncbi:hypothetical protein LOD99_13616 [Oopsacas minuta]|uniref:Uncharacterized protein n=1 Tax=Oopsacas minuta TaxID=111878 RepID=A0AAV7KHR8_9METZ|nr:hypothetical protein LOD99_13616 [Oopsacas minuta]